MILLILWAVWARPCAPLPYEEERARLAPDDCVRVARAALSAQRKAIHQSDCDGVAASQLLEGALQQLEDARLDASGLYLGVLQELARVRLDQGHADEAAALMARVVAGCEAGLTIGRSRRGEWAGSGRGRNACSRGACARAGACCRAQKVCRISYVDELLGLTARHTAVTFARVLMTGLI